MNKQAKEPSPLDPEPQRSVGILPANLEIHGQDARAPFDFKEQPFKIVANMDDFTIEILNP